MNRTMTGESAYLLGREAFRRGLPVVDDPTFPGSTVPSGSSGYRTPPWRPGGRERWALRPTRERTMVASGARCARGRPIRARVRRRAAWRRRRRGCCGACAGARRKRRPQRAEPDRRRSRVRRDGNATGEAKQFPRRRRDPWPCRPARSDQILEWRPSLSRSGVRAHALDHGAHAVRALRREMLLQTQRAKGAQGVDGKNLLWRAIREKRHRDRDQPANEVRTWTRSKRCRSA